MPEKDKVFSKLLCASWVLVLLPIIFRVLKYFSPNIGVARNIEHLFYLVLLLVWFKWLSIAKGHYHESYIKMTRDKIIWIILLLLVVLGSKFLGFVFAILLILKSLVLSPLVFTKKFDGPKKEQEKLKTVGIVGAVIFIIELLFLSTTIHRESQYPRFFSNCVHELMAQGHHIEVSTKYCECMFDYNNHDYCVQLATTQTHP